MINVITILQNVVELTDERFCDSAFWAISLMSFEYLAEQNGQGKDKHNNIWLMASADLMG